MSKIQRKFGMNPNYFQEIFEIKWTIFEYLNCCDKENLVWIR